MLGEAEIRRALDAHGDAVRRICFLHLHNRGDVEDIFQEVFLKYALREAEFESDAHQRAWLLRVSINACKDLNKSFWRRKTVSLELAKDQSVPLSGETREVLDAVLLLRPPKYRNVIYLHYYEGYQATEIAEILGEKENTIYTWLRRARAQLKTALGGDGTDG